MKRWDLRGLPWRPHNPDILSSSKQGRAIVLDLPAGETLQDHEVHGAVTVTQPDGQVVEAEPGMLVYVAPKERHAVTAVSDARMLLLLTPWPGPGHPGAMTLEQKADVRDRAAERAR
jgi:quercetin dioxygenase-like cupin family protein